WSPDGTQTPIIGGTNICVLDVDGQNLTSVAGSTSNNPAWSPVGGTMAFDRSSQIWTMDANGGNEVQLPAGGDYPSWSPDGTTVAYVSGGDIWLADSTGTPTVGLTSTDAIEGQTHWSPDGSRIVYHSDETGVTQIYTMAADGTDVVQLTTDGASHAPSWSPFLTPLVAVTSPVAGDLLPLGTTSLDVTVALGNHSAPGTWAWQLDTPFPASGPVAENVVTAESTTTTATGLSDGQTYTLYVALVDGAGDLLSPSVTDSVTFSVDDPPTLSITAPTEGEQFSVGTTSVELTVNQSNHPSPGHWHWQLDTPFAASGQAGGFEVAAGTATDTITGLTDGAAYTALVDGSDALLSLSVTASATFTVGSLTDSLPSPTSRSAPARRSPSPWTSMT
ncbi:MAG: hypothetical protein ABGY41_13950, partial [Candidatus Poribacteria bacterium]